MLIDVRWGVVQLAGFRVLVPAMRVQVPPPQFRPGVHSDRCRCEHMFVTQARPVRPVADADLLWLAGLLEGEGTFMAGSPSAPRSPVVQVSMADRDVVERVADLLDCAVTVVPARRNGWRTAYSARVKGPRAMEWMRRLRPLMGARRREQIDHAMASWAPDPTRHLDDRRAADALACLARGESVRDVAARFGTSVWCIYDLRLGRTHKHVARRQAA
jgi:hypothetical protein